MSTTADHSPIRQPSDDRMVIGKSYAESREGQAPTPPDATGAPNILWILLDDVGFGATSPFGGPCHTPNFDRLAANGLRYTNFHTTAVCSPSRAALLTGRNHHNVGMGLLPQTLMAAEFPGYTGRMVPENGTVADYLRLRGYSTYWLGKSHLVPDAEATDLGPFDRWPSGMGFDHFLGFLGGCTDQFQPDLVEDNQHVAPDGQHLTTQLTDKAISYIERQKKLAPDRPFFMYFSPGATHEPHQVDREWIDKYKGAFDDGWDVCREQIFARQQALGVISPQAKLPARNPRVQAWDSLTRDQQRLYARFMEAYAGFMEHTDHEIGRLLDYLDTTGQLENTAIFLMIGDNGADVGGGHNGEIELTFPLPITKTDAEQVAEMLERYDAIGTAETYTDYPIGWAQVANTPYRDWKTMAHSEGGARCGMIVHWPQGIAANNGIREQYTYLTDLLPTSLEIAGAKAPAVVKGISQTPVQGVSFAQSFDDPSAPSKHHTQYFFLYGTGAIYHDGWKASFGYRPDFIDLFMVYPRPETAENYAGREVWELYNVDDDPTEVNDLASSHPAKLQEMQALFAAEAEANHVYPLINWSDLYPRFQDFLKALKD